ncbi:HEAT repeat protein [Methanomicrobium sp. W14]|uniref:HEAT repeat domain-containing protein n=1 Tax=Methanomicrobium sp. W14 TaxID=2817839 RepID=UPI001AE23AA1|nr:HEAT repeat domain-containing protein [Methanomicrobium sp. W14]MBP2133907.1 HEAT repeat protein [Methanomicrobium sp. W14]
MALFDRKENSNRENQTDEIETLMLSLGSKEWKIRENAAVRLTEIGKPAIIHLLKALNSDNSLVRTGAAEVLGTYGEAALPTLLKLVTTGNERVRDGAARAIGQNGDTALNPLKETLNSKNYRARRGAVLSLGYLGYLGTEVEELLVAALEDKNDKVREESAKSLENINWKPKSRVQMALFFNAKNDIESLVKLGKDSLPILQTEVIKGTADKKRGIAEVLSKYNDEQSLILLIKLLEDNDGSVRQKAAEAAGNLRDRRLVPYIVKKLEDSDSYVRMEAVWALDKTGWKPSDNGQKARYLMIKEKWTDLLQMRESALPYLIESLKDQNPGVRLKSAEVLRAMGNIGYSAINDALKSEDKELKKGAIEAAALIKKKNAENLKKKPGKKPRTPDEEVEEQIKRQKESMASKNSAKEDFWAALMRKNGLDEERTVRFSKALSDDNEIIRAAAVESLKNAGEAGIECMKALLSDGKNNVRIAAIESLGDIKATSAASYLVRLTKDKNENVRTASVHSLGQIKEEKTLPAIINLFSDKSLKVRTEASDSAAKFGVITLGILKDVFADQDMTVRMNAIRTISKIDDWSSISQCVRMLNDSEYDVRECAVKALISLSEYLFNPLIDESQRVLIQGTYMEKTGMIAALSGIEDLRAKQALSTFETDDDESIRNHAKQALYGTSGEEKIVPKQEKRPVKDKNSSDKMTAEIRKVISDLKSEDSSVQMKAAEKVFIIGEDMIEPLIEELAESGENPSFQNFVAEILTGLGDRAIQGLIKSLKDGNTGTKIIAAQSLGKIPEKVTIDALCETLYKEEIPEVRKVAAESLGFMGDHRSVDALIFASKEDNPAVKSAAIRSLGYINDSKAVKPLINVLEEGNEQVNRLAVESLKSFGKDAIEGLTEELGSVNCHNRPAVAHALDEMNWVPETEESISLYLIAKKHWKELEKIGKPAIKPLSYAVFDEDINTRLAAVVTLGSIGGEETVPILAKALCDNSQVVRKEAETAIISIGRRAVPVLENIVANAENPTQRTFTMNILRKIES